MAVAYTSRGVVGDRSATAGCLAMIYTVYKGVGLGIRAVAADFHDTPQGITHHVTLHRRFFLTPLILMVVESKARRVCV